VHLKPGAFGERGDLTRAVADGLLTGDGLDVLLARAREELGREPTAGAEHAGDLGCVRRGAGSGHVLEDREHRDRIDGVGLDRREVGASDDVEVGPAAAAHQLACLLDGLMGQVDADRAIHKRAEVPEQPSVPASDLEQRVGRVGCEVPGERSASAARRSTTSRTSTSTLPRDRLIVMTGLSGSGKSSLAFDTIFAEGQRKYMESLSAYARQFLDQLKKPDVEEIEGIPPTIAIEQRSAAHNPRSTVATTTEIYDYLRLLYARCGTPRSWAPTKTKKDGTVTARSGRLIEASSASQIVDHVCGFDEGTRLMVLAPVIRGKKGHHKDTLEEFFKDGWGRVRVNGDVVDLRDALKEGGENPLGPAPLQEAHDRGRGRPRRHPRRRPAAARGVDRGGAAPRRGVGRRRGERRRRTGDVDRPHVQREVRRPGPPRGRARRAEPALFSFNSPYGACPTCHGLGAILEFDRGLVVPDPDARCSRAGSRRGRRTGPAGWSTPVPPPALPGVRGARATTPMGELDDDYETC
jgi:hypothetical protein